MTTTAIGVTTSDPKQMDRAELEARLQEAEDTLAAIRNGEVDAVVVHGQDGQAIYTLENADRPYRVLVEQMIEGAITLSSDGTILYCNQRFAEIVQRSRQTILGTNVSQLFESHEGDRFQSLLTQSSNEGISGEYALRSDRGGSIPVNISLVDLEMDEAMERVICGVVTDLSNHHQRRHELSLANARLATEIDERKRAEDGLQLALDAAGMGSWDYDCTSGIVHRTGSYDAIAALDDPAQLLTLERLVRMFVREDQAAAKAAFDKALIVGSIDFEGRMHRQGGSQRRSIHLKGRTFYQAGRAVRIAGVISDVTEQRELEDQLRQSQKMEAVGQLTGGIAHDFNNLLMVIGGSLEILKRRVPEDPRLRPLFDAAEQGVSRGAKLNHQLLAFSRRQALDPKVIHVDDLIDSFQDLLDRAVGETIQLQLVKSSRLIHCHADPHLLETAILNLAINARDAMPKGGTLIISVENRQVDSALASAHGVEVGEYATVVVSDTGSGMDEALLNRVFEPFFTTKDVGKGTGLGLSQVYGFAKQSEGFVTITSSVGVGTSVAIYLPRVVESDSEAPASEAAKAVIRGEGCILVVEDDSDVRAVTVGMLLELGYSVCEAENAKVAEQVFASREIDVVLTDVIMPGGMSGVDLAIKLRSSRPSLPVLLTSGFTAQLMLTQGLPADYPVLRKPYTLVALAEAVSKAFD